MNMKNLLFLLLFATSCFGQTQNDNQNTVNVYTHPTVSESYVVPTFDKSVHLQGTEIKLEDGSMYISTGDSWMLCKEPDFTGVATDDKTILGNGIDTLLSNGWSVDYQSNVNGAKYVRNTGTSNLVYNLTDVSELPYYDGDMIFAKTSNTGTLTLAIEAGETYTIDGLSASFILLSGEDVILQYDDLLDNWSVVGGSRQVRTVLAKSNKMAQMVNAATPTSNYNVASFKIFDQWNTGTAINDDATNTYAVTGTYIRSKASGTQRYKVDANIHLTCASIGGKVRAEVFVDGVTTGTVFLSDESTINSSDITVQINQIVSVPFFDDIDIRLIGIGTGVGTSSITTGSTGGSYFRVTKMN